MRGNRQSENWAGHLRGRRKMENNVGEILYSLREEKKTDRKSFAAAFVWDLPCANMKEEKAYRIAWF